MTHRLLIIIVLLLGAINSQTQTKSSFVNTVKGISDTPPEGYVPPLVSNGSLSMLIDYKGGQTQQQYAGLTPGIYWAGRRYGQLHPSGELIPFGYFEQELSINGKKQEHPTTWEQTLDTKKALVMCKNNYEDDLSVETIIFTHIEHNVIVIKKRITSVSSEIQTAEVVLNYHFTPPGNSNRLPKRTKSESEWNPSAQRARFHYEIDGYKTYKGVISLLSDQPTDAVIDDQIVRMVTKVDLTKEKAAEITCYLFFFDSLDGADYQERADQLETAIRQEAFDGLLDSHVRQWEAYHGECFVKLPDPHMEKVYNTAQYHLRANATQWSFPVGILPSHWNGKYFGWDETFCFQALASSNHLSISKRCPEFRHKTLPKALNRVAHYGKPGLFGARYPWLGLEDGTEEATVYAFYIDHVFHTSNIALSAWMQYLYNGDRDYLRSTGFPVIRECARYYVSHIVYENPDGSMYIGKCTDLERLGPAVQNPFMTSCGAIYTLEVAAKAATLLNENEEESVNWLHIASKLRESLPRENNMYVPFLECKEKSIASLAGLFPYPLFDSTNDLQKNAAYDFVTNGKAFGNMYPMGASICPWYAGWIAAALALLGDKKEPVSLLADAAKSAGYFGELFEINEPGIHKVPWFSTASGNYIYGINQMLIQCEEDTIRISPAVPDTWNDYSFHLACYGNLTATVSVKKGKITALTLTAPESATETYRTLIIPDQMIDIKKINKKAMLSIDTDNNNHHIYVKLNNKTSII